MADKKISELTNITGSTIADTDEFVVVDSSASETKAITAAELRTAIGNGDFTVTGNLTVQGTTITVDSAAAQNIVLGDNDKMTFGAGSDLQIYHSGSNSIIRDTGAGDLYLAGDANVYITNSALGEFKAAFTTDGAASLYYDNATKLATTSTGIDVTGTVVADAANITGTVTADGLTVDGVGTITSTAVEQLTLQRSGTGTQSGAMFIKDASGNPIRFVSTNSTLQINTGASNTKRMQIDNAGDISFYEDTGTTAKFFWDASAESLGIGTSSPASFFSGGNQIVVGDGSGAQGLTIYAESTNHGQILFADGTTGNEAYRGILRYDHVTDSMQIMTAGATERMRIDSSGNVGIGTSSPSQKLQVKTTGADTVISILSDNNQRSLLLFADTDDADIGAIVYDHTSNFMKFHANNTERMRIDSSGHLLVGTTSPILSAANRGNITLNGTSESIINLGVGGVQGGYLYQTATDLALWNTKNGPLRFATNNTETMRIDSSGNVGIGTSSPTFTSAYGGLHVHSTYPEIHLTGTDSGSGASDGFKIQKNSANHVYLWNYENAFMAFGTNNAEAMRIDSSGNLLVGTTDVTIGYTDGDVGFAVDGTNGYFGVARSPSSSTQALAYLNRLNSDGDITQFRKDGTTVGSIGAGSGEIFIGNGDMGIRFDNISDAIKPYNPSSLAVKDASIDIGVSTQRFKDLYLSGGVHLGGTGSANKLDDYETGTWTPTFNGDSSDPTVTYNVQNGDYTKVGRIVHVRCHLEITGTASGGGGGLYIGGLPFTSANDGYVAGTVSYKADWDTDAAPTMCLVNPNTTKIPLYLPTSSDPRSSSTRSQVSHLGTNTQIYLAVSYNI